MSLTVDVQYAAPCAGAPDSAAFERWVAAALAGFRGDRDMALTVRIADEAEVADLNGRFRGRERPTNVLSFPAELPDVIAPRVLGDIVLCAPVVRREAEEQGKCEQAHWAHLTVHGVLHLLGFDHQDDRQAAEMEGMERRILGELNYPDPYESIETRR